MAVGWAKFAVIRKGLFGAGIVALLGMAMGLGWIGCTKGRGPETVNFAHLEHLTEPFRLNGDSAAIVHIYSEYPEYDWVDASGEGIACVDDVARAAILYLRHFQLHGDRVSLARAKSFLHFVLYMQLPDGRFYNFIDHRGEINRTGQTSRASFGWWAVRAYEALALGIQVFSGEDPLFAARLKRAFLRCRKPLSSLLARYGEWILWRDRRYPAWLVNGTAADASAVLLRALTLFLHGETAPFFEKAALQLAEGIRAMQLNSRSRFPGAFLSYRDIWHAWGNSQADALAQFATFSGESVWKNAAEQEVRAFLPVLLLEDWFAEYHLSADSLVRYPQIAYGVRCAVLGALSVYRATGKVRYAHLAGLLASWFLGNNGTGKPMYDAETGRGYDGITGPDRINRNAGAESTIEALRTLLEVGATRQARPFLRARFLEPVQEERMENGTIRRFRRFRLPEQKPWILEYFPAMGDFRIRPEATRP